MQLILILLRHGEAEDGEKGADHARRLTKRGQAQVSAVAGQLKSAGFIPSLALSSDAARTRETCQGLLKSMKFPAEYIRDLYLGDLGTVRALLAARDAALHPSILLVGHNPHLSTVGCYLSGDAVALGTADAVVLSVEGESWAEAGALLGTWEIKQMFYGN